MATLNSLQSWPSALASIDPETTELNPYVLRNTENSRSKSISLSISPAPVERTLDASRRSLNGCETWSIASLGYSEPSSGNICCEASVCGLDIQEQRGNSELKSCHDNVGSKRKQFSYKDYSGESAVKGPFPQFLLAVNRTIADSPTIPVKMAKECKSAIEWASQSSKLSSILSQATCSGSPLQSSSHTSFRNMCKLSEPVKADTDMPGDHHKRNFLMFSDGEDGSFNDPFKHPKILDSSSPGKNSQTQLRKEKLGDRIMALQQLVSPFGKTDTASVLLEAIGYIKFLQEQVQVFHI
eukprot:c28567_g1_i2 orf=500-1390(+)